MELDGKSVLSLRAGSLWSRSGMMSSASMIGTLVKGLTTSKLTILSLGSSLKFWSI